MAALPTGSSCPTSSVTAANSSSGGTPRATSVAMRRKAACSSASTRDSSPITGALNIDSQGYSCLAATFARLAQQAPRLSALRA
jgi:hypothetical protein